MKKRRFRWFRVFLLLGLVLLAGFAWLLTPHGLQQVSSVLQTWLADQTGAEVSIEGPGISPPFVLTLDRLEMKNRQGDGIRLENARLHLSLRALLRRDILLRHLGAEKLVVNANPLPPPLPSETEAGPPQMPDWDSILGSFQVERLAFPHISLLPPLFPEPREFSLTGRLSQGQLSLSLDAEADPQLGKTRLSLTAQPDRQGLGFTADLAAEPLALTVTGSLRDLQLALDARLGIPDTGPAPLLDAEIIHDLTSGETRLTLKPLITTWNGIDFAFVEPPVLRHQSGEILLYPAELRLGRGRVRLQGRLQGDALDVQTEVLELPLDLFGLAGVTDPGASLTGDLHLGGTLAAPVADLALDFRGLRPKQAERWDGAPARFRVAAHLQPGALRTSLRLEELPGDPVTLDLRLPLSLSLLPWSFDLPDSGEVQGRLQANTDLAGLSRLFVLDVYHQLRGSLVADFQLNGTVGDPRIQGEAGLVRGRYEHELLGIILRDIDLSIQAQREEIRLDFLRAADAGRGRIEARGALKLNPAADFPFEISLNLNQFQLLRSDQIESLGHGRLNLSGNRTASTLRGQLRLTPMEIRIPEQPPPALTELEVIEIRPGAAPPPPPEPESRPPRHQMALALALEAPERIFVRGRGLDSEWSAHVQVAGTADHPQLVGHLELIRGRFVFLGRRILLARGRIQLDGAYPPDPLLDLAAEIRGGGITATVEITGPASMPEIRLSSSPPLPEDEVLARILFGRESNRITPWQALMLAQALNQLRGGGTAFDVMGETRRVLRVDQIDIRTADEQQGETSIAVGKYLSDRIYVELEQGVGAESGRATVEVELTPTLRLETQTGAHADVGIGIIWTWDF